MPRIKRKGGIKEYEIPSPSLHNEEKWLEETQAIFEQGHPVIMMSTMSWFPSQRCWLKCEIEEIAEEQSYRIEESHEGIYWFYKKT